MAITKTDFMRGMQCRKMLWLDRHKPGLRVIPPEVQVRLDAGNDFGDRAMAMFGPYEEMTVYRQNAGRPSPGCAGDLRGGLQQLQQLLCRGSPAENGNRP